MAKAKGKRNHRKEKLEFVQDYLPIRDLKNGIIETTDNRYIKILEIEPINFTLRSDEEQFNIISSFASWLKISPMRLQFKSITRRADSDKHISMICEELEHEENPQCKELGEDYIGLIKDVGNREALTRRFFLIFQYEAVGRNESDDYAKIYGMLQTAEQTARAYFMQCGNSIVQSKDPDEATAEILYMFYNRRSCTDEPFSSRVDRIVVDTMAAKKKIIGMDPVPPIRMTNFLAPRGIDLSHYNYVVMDGLYYSFLYIKAGGYPSRVRAGWMSSLINAGEGVDIDVHLRRENRSRTIDKVAQRIRLNRTKLKSMQDTSTDYEELTNSIQAGYFIKNGIANYNEDLFYMSVFITVSAKTYEELLWRKQQMVDILYSLSVSLNGQNTLLSSDFSFIPKNFSLENYRRVLFGEDILTWLGNSVYLAVVTVSLSLCAAIPAAYCFSRRRFPGRRPILKCLVLLNSFPAVLSMFAVYRLLRPMGLINHRTGLILIYTGTMAVFSLWNIKGYFDTVPVEIEEAARMDGADPLQVVTRIVLPLAKPSIVVTALMVLIYVWNEYIYATTFMTGEENYTLAAGLYALQATEMSGSWPVFAAASITVSIPVLIIFFLCQKHMTSGLTAGGVKG